MKTTILYLDIICKSLDQTNTDMVPLPPSIEAYDIGNKNNIKVLKEARDILQQILDVYENKEIPRPVPPTKDLLTHFAATGEFKVLVHTQYGDGYVVDADEEKGRLRVKLSDDRLLWLEETEATLQDLQGDPHIVESFIDETIKKIGDGSFFKNLVKG